MRFIPMTGLTLVAIVSIAGAAQALPSADYVKKAGAGDLYEIKSSKLVMTTANPKLKKFAAMMVTDHTKSTAMVKAAAGKSGLKPKPPMLSAKQAGDLAALRAASGADRDTLYVTQQKAAHQEALALHQDESANGKAKPLKAAATKIVPVVEGHIAMLDTM